MRDVREMNKLNLTGQVIGKLTVICEVPKPEGSKSTCSYWLCKCSCGREIIIDTGQLRRKTRTSCGCDKAEKISQKKRKSNIYDLSGDYGICYASNTDDKILFDLEDYDKIKDYCWNIMSHNVEGRKEYKKVHTMTYGCEHRKHLFMHRVILGINDSSITIDHINRNTLDNRKSNLRICSQQQNICNTEPRSGKYKGTSMHKLKDGSERWVAQISANHVKYRLGTYNTEEEAALAYNKAAKELHGEFAYLNDVHLEDEIKEVI